MFTLLYEFQDGADAPSSISFKPDSYLGRFAISRAFGFVLALIVAILRGLTRLLLPLLLRLLAGLLAVILLAGLLPVLLLLVLSRLLLEVLIVSHCSSLGICSMLSISCKRMRIRSTRKKIISFRMFELNIARK
jgi:hypothetical protein